jgi:hypothetical protein
MIPIWLIGAAALGLLFRKGGKNSAYTDGEGPYDRYPSGTDAANVVSINNVKASSGNPYTVREFKRSGGQVYYVAVRSDGSKDWVGYLFDPVSKARVLYSANAETSEAVDVLRKDFGL